MSRPEKQISATNTTGPLHFLEETKFLLPPTILFAVSGSRGPAPPTHRPPPNRRPPRKTYCHSTIRLGERRASSPWRRTRQCPAGLHLLAPRCCGSQPPSPIRDPSPSCRVHHILPCPSRCIRVRLSTAPPKFVQSATDVHIRPERVPVPAPPGPVCPGLDTRVRIYAARGVLWSCSQSPSCHRGGGWGGWISNGLQPVLPDCQPPLGVLPCDTPGDGGGAICFCPTCCRGRRGAEELRKRGGSTAGASWHDRWRIRERPRLGLSEHAGV